MISAKITIMPDGQVIKTEEGFFTVEKRVFDMLPFLRVRVKKLGVVVINKSTIQKIEPYEK